MIFLFIGLWIWSNGFYRTRGRTVHVWYKVAGLGRVVFVLWVHDMDRTDKWTG